MDYYLNLPLQLRHGLSAIDLINNPPQPYIYFKEYFDVMNTTFQIDESCNNSDENLIHLKIAWRTSSIYICTFAMSSFIKLTITGFSMTIGEKI